MTEPQDDKHEVVSPIPGVPASDLPFPETLPVSDSSPSHTSSSSSSASSSSSSIGETMQSPLKNLFKKVKPKVKAEYEEKLKQERNNTMSNIDNFVSKTRKVTVTKAAGQGLGFALAPTGAAAVVPGVLIVELLVGGPTAATGLVNLGDQLLHVNGQSLIGLPFEKAKNIIRGLAGLTTVELELATVDTVHKPASTAPTTTFKPVNADANLTSAFTNTLKFTIKKKLGVPLGVSVSPTLRGAVIPGFWVSALDTKNIEPESKDENENLMLGDQLMSLNGQSLTGLNAKKITQLLKECSKFTDVRIELARASKALCHQLPGGPPAMVVADGVVKSVESGGVADQAGFKPGQRILTVQDVSVYPETKKIKNFLKSEQPLTVWTIEPRYEDPSATIASTTPPSSTLSTPRARRQNNDDGVSITLSPQLALNAMGDEEDVDEEENVSAQRRYSDSQHSQLPPQQPRLSDSTIISTEPRLSSSTTRGTPDPRFDPARQATLVLPAEVPRQSSTQRPSTTQDGTSMEPPATSQSETTEQSGSVSGQQRGSISKNASNETSDEKFQARGSTDSTTARRGSGTRRASGGVPSFSGGAEQELDQAAAFGFEFQSDVPPAQEPVVSRSSSVSKVVGSTDAPRVSTTDAPRVSTTEAANANPNEAAESIIQNVHSNRLNRWKLEAEKQEQAELERANSSGETRSSVDVPRASQTHVDVDARSNTPKRGSLTTVTAVTAVSPTVADSFGFEFQAETPRDDLNIASDSFGFELPSPQPAGQDMGLLSPKPFKAPPPPVVSSTENLTASAPFKPPPPPISQEHSEPPPPFKPPPQPVSISTNETTSSVSDLATTPPPRPFKPPPQPVATDESTFNASSEQYGAPRNSQNAPETSFASGLVPVAILSASHNNDDRRGSQVNDTERGSLHQPSLSSTAATTTSPAADMMKDDQILAETETGGADEETRIGVKQPKFKSLKPGEKDEFESKLNQTRDFATANVDNFLSKTRSVTVPKKRKEGLGFILLPTGPQAVVPGVVVDKLLVGGPAASTGLVNIGDQVLTVNNKSLVGLSYAQAKDIIRDVKKDTEVQLELVALDVAHRPVKIASVPHEWSSADASLAPVYGDLQKCTVSKAAGAPLSFSMSPTLPGAFVPGMWVSQLGPDAGDLRLGDQIMAIDGQSLTGLNLKQVRRLFKEYSKVTEVHFDVARPVEPVHHQLQAGGDHGLTIENGIIRAVEPGSPGEQAQFTAGERILTIQGESVYPKTKKINTFLTGGLLLDVWSIKPRHLPASPTAASASIDNIPSSQGGAALLGVAIDSDHYYHEEEDDEGDEDDEEDDVEGGRTLEEARRRALLMGFATKEEEEEAKRQQEETQGLEPSSAYIGEEKTRPIIPIRKKKGRKKGFKKGGSRVNAMGVIEEGEELSEGFEGDETGEDSSRRGSEIAGASALAAAAAVAGKRGSQDNTSQTHADIGHDANMQSRGSLSEKHVATGHFAEEPSSEPSEEYVDTASAFGFEFQVPNDPDHASHAVPTDDQHKLPNHGQQDFYNLHPSVLGHGDFGNNQHGSKPGTPRGSQSDANRNSVSNLAGPVAGVTEEAVRNAKFSRPEAGVAAFGQSEYVGIPADSFGATDTSRSSQSIPPSAEPVIESNVVVPRTPLPAPPREVGVAGVTEEAVRDARFSSSRPLNATQQSEFSTIPTESFGSDQQRRSISNADGGRRGSLTQDSLAEGGAAVGAASLNERGSVDKIDSTDGISVEQGGDVAITIEDTSSPGNVEKKKFKKLRPREKDAYESKLTQTRSFTTANVDNFLSKTRRVTVPKTSGQGLGVIVLPTGPQAVVPGVVVDKMMVGGPAASTGLISIGDQILTVNSKSLIGLPYSQAKDIIRDVKTDTEVVLEVVALDVAHRPVTIEPVPHEWAKCDPSLADVYDQPERCTVYKKAGTPLSLTIYPTLPGAVVPGVWISHVGPESGDLELGDHLMSVDGHSLTGLNERQVAKVLKECNKASEVHFEVVRPVHPVNHQLQSGGAHGLTVDNGGVVTKVEPGSPAEQAKFVVGQRILTMQGESVFPKTRKIQSYLKSGAMLNVWSIQQQQSSSSSRGSSGGIDPSLLSLEPSTSYASEVVDLSAPSTPTGYYFQEEEEDDVANNGEEEDDELSPQDLAVIDEARKRAEERRRDSLLGWATTEEEDRAREEGKDKPLVPKKKKRGDKRARHAKKVARLIALGSIKEGDEVSEDEGEGDDEDDEEEELGGGAYRPSGGGVMSFAIPDSEEDEEDQDIIDRSENALAGGRGSVNEGRRGSCNRGSSSDGGARGSVSRRDSRGSVGGVPSNEPIEWTLAERIDDSLPLANNNIGRGSGSNSSSGSGRGSNSGFSLVITPDTQSYASSPISVQSPFNLADEAKKQAARAALFSSSRDGSPERSRSSVRVPVSPLDLPPLELIPHSGAITPREGRGSATAFTTEHIANYRDLPCLLDPEVGVKLSYADLGMKLRTVARRLKDHGLRRGDVLLLACGYHIYNPLILHAALLIGAVVSCCNPASDLLATHLSDSRASFVCTTAQYLDEIKLALDNRTLVHTIVVLDTPHISRIFCKQLRAVLPFEGLLHPDLEEEVSYADTLDAVRFLEPKAVRLTHSEMVANLQLCASELPLQQGDAVLVCLPFFQLCGQSLVNVAFRQGCTVLFPPSNASPSTILNMIKLHGVNYVVADPSQAEDLTNEITRFSPAPGAKMVGPYDLSTLKAICGVVDRRDDEELVSPRPGRDSLDLS